MATHLRFLTNKALRMSAAVSQDARDVLTRVRDGEAGAAVLRPSGEGPRPGRPSRSPIDSPIYLRAKLVGTTHISMAVLECLDTVVSMGKCGDGGRGGCGLQGVEAQSGRVDTGAKRREVRKAEVSEVGPAAFGLAPHVMPVIPQAPAWSRCRRARGILS